MTKLKIIVSPFYSEEGYKDEVTGFVFRKTDSPYIVTLDDDRLKGIKEGLRKNFLIPYDKETLEFIAKNDLPLTPLEPSKPVTPEPEPEPEPEEPTPPQPEETPGTEESPKEEEEVAPVAKKTTRKRTKKAPAEATE